MAGNKKKSNPNADKTAKKKRDGADDALPANADDQREERLPSPQQREYRLPRLAADGLIWLVIWSCLFLCFDGCRKVIRQGLPSIRFEWTEPDAKTSLGRWILAERPALLKGDFPAVGRALGETARRLRAGELDNMNAAAADTIARAQPEVCDPAQWRTFLSRLGGQLEGGSLEKLADQYEEAASYFLPKAAGATGGGYALGDTDGSRSPRCGSDGNFAVQSLIEATEVEDEKVDDETDPPAGDRGGAVVDERPDEVEDIPVGGGPDSPAVSADEGKVGGNESGTASGCPGGQCPAPSYSRFYSPSPWPVAPAGTMPTGLPW